MASGRKVLQLMLLVFSGMGLLPITIQAQGFYQRDYFEAWPRSPLQERIHLAERIGNQGRARFAAEQGWSKFLGSQRRSIPQGLDAAYWDPHISRIRPLEAKGGTSRVKDTFLARQGTNRNAIRSAKYVLGRQNITQSERLAHALVIRAAQRNGLETGVIRTRHGDGRPSLPRLEGKWDRTSVAREAAKMERDLVRQDPRLKSVFGEAAKEEVRLFGTSRSAARMARVARAGGNVLIVVGAAGSGYQTYRDYGQYRRGEISGTRMAAKGTIRGTQGVLLVYAAVTPEPVSKLVAAGAATLLGIGDEINNHVFEIRRQHWRQMLQDIDRDELHRAVRRQLLNEEVLLETAKDDHHQ